jgi:hypothetical protein
MTNNVTVGAEILVGYSGGMALYVANWQSVLYLFEMVEAPDLLPELNYLTSLN